MSATKHTPGPWFHDQRSNIVKTVATSERLGSRLHTFVCDANGAALGDVRLIVASPELLDAAQITSSASPVQRELEAMPDDKEITITFTAADLKQIRAAIAKARGGK